jgi:beta-galactosidase
MLDFLCLKLQVHVGTILKYKRHPNVEYVPGALEAIGFRQGKRITEKMETTGDAYQIVLSTSKPFMTADGRDAVVINVGAIDNDNRKVPDAQNLIQFSLRGDATIIGVGNGDPSSLEKDKCDVGDWKRKLFNGKCQLILQAGKKTESVTIEARSKDLKSALVVMQMK